jgi:REP element-mobilizing transposase RayT
MASHPPRLKDFSYIGKHRYFLTFCTLNGFDAFVDAEIFEAFTSQLLQSSTLHCVAVDVYCTMPDHAHVVVQGTTETADARAFMHHFKQHTGWQHRATRGRRLWQGSYYDHVLREEEGSPG